MLHNCNMEEEIQSSPMPKEEDIPEFVRNFAEREYSFK